MVEARRIELLSKGAATQASPSAVCNLSFAPLTPTDKLRRCYLVKVSQSVRGELDLRYPAK